MDKEDKLKETLYVNINSFFQQNLSTSALLVVCNLLCALTVLNDLNLFDAETIRNIMKHE